MNDGGPGAGTGGAGGARGPMSSVKQTGAEFETILIRGYRPEIDRAQERVLSALERLGYPDASRFAVRLAMEEAITNAFHHGHKGLGPEDPIRLDFCAAPERVELIVEDQGPGFDPGAVPDPTKDENLEVPTGRGLLLMRAYMSEVEFNERGNRVRMVYRRPDLARGEGPAPAAAAEKTGDNSGC